MSVRLVPVSHPVAQAVLGTGSLGDALGVLALRPAPGWPHADTATALHATAEHGAAVGTFLIVHGEEVVGDCGWRAAPDSEGQVEIGYGLARPQLGRGWGGAAVAALCTWSADQDGVRTLRAETHPDNLPSQRLLRRLGFQGPEPTDDPAQVRYVRDA
ncbi:MAG: GNAT family N-acetyltransferase [Mycobacteriales bacterium]